MLSGRSGFDGDVSPFSAKSDYTIGYLTQEPDFDDQKTVLDTVLSSDLREMQLIRDYEYLMADYREENQARLEKVMAEMDSLNAWEIESQVKTVLSKLGIEDLKELGIYLGFCVARVHLPKVFAVAITTALTQMEPTNHPGHYYHRMVDQF